MIYLRAFVRRVGHNMGYGRWRAIGQNGFIGRNPAKMRSCADRGRGSNQMLDLNRQAWVNLMRPEKILDVATPRHGLMTAIGKVTPW